MIAPRRAARDPRRAGCPPRPPPPPLGAWPWRRRWARDWDNVKYCSERCRRSKPAGTLIPGESPADQKHPATQPARNRSRR
ncbi:MAG: DUF2256 domain-containing protein [Planctomycetaceae bacterium]